MTCSASMSGSKPGQAAQRNRVQAVQICPKPSRPVQPSKSAGPALTPPATSVSLAMPRR